MSAGTLGRWTLLVNGRFRAQLEQPSVPGVHYERDDGDVL